MSIPVIVTSVREKATSVRWLSAGFITVVTLVTYLDRAVFSVAAGPLMEAFHITPVELGVCMTIFSVGYGLFQIPGSAVIHRLGAYKTIALAMVVWSVLTALTGLAGSFILLLFVRFLFGVAESPVYPALNNFTAHWFPKEERARANSWSSTGSFAGNIVGPPIVVAIVSWLGWQSGFYFCGAMGVVVTLIWYLSMRTDPVEHPWVNAKELAIITDNSDVVVAHQVKTPWKVFLRQRSFWAIAMGYFGTMWTVQFFVFWLPYYLQAARGISFQGLGFYASMPWVALCICVFLAGNWSDWLTKKGYSRFWARNMNCVGGLFISALALVGTAMAQSVNETLFFLCVAVGIIGFAQTTSWSLATDIGREYTAAVSSWMNTWGFVAASLNPILAPVIAKNFGWDAVLIVNACVMVIGMVGYFSIKSDEPLKTI